MGTYYCIANTLGFHTPPLSAPGAELEEARSRLRSMGEQQVSIAARSQGSKQNFVCNGLQLHIAGGAGLAENVGGQSQEVGHCCNSSTQHGCVRGNQRIKLAGSSSRAAVGLRRASSHLGLTLAVDPSIRLGSAGLCLLRTSGCELGN